MQIISNIGQIVSVGPLQFLNIEPGAAVTGVSATIFEPEILLSEGTKLLPVCDLRIPIVVTARVNLESGKERVYVVKRRIEKSSSGPITVRILIDVLVECFVVLALQPMLCCGGHLLPSGKNLRGAVGCEPPTIVFAAEDDRKVEPGLREQIDNRKLRIADAIFQI